MEKSKAVYSYTETRLNLQPAYPGSIIQLSLPQSSSNWNPLAQKRNIFHDAHSHDEASFSRHHLATESSIFFRSERRYPRSFLWRILDDRKLLEIQSVDLTHDLSEKQEALLTLQLRFPKPLQPYGIAFADSEEKDALLIFALTTAGTLYTLTFGKDIFIHTKASESLASDWCKIFIPPAFRIKTPYRLFAIDAHQLFITLTDGDLLKLNREAGHDGSFWRESYFTTSGWSLSLPKALAKWKGETFVPFEGSELDGSTTSSLALSPDDESIFTICLNNTLRVWNAKSGQVTMQLNLLDKYNSSPNPPKFLMGPNQKQLLQLLDVTSRDVEKYYLVTFTPKTRQFNFWAVMDADSGVDGMERVQPEFEFVPPVDELMDTTSWILEEYFVSAAPKWASTKIWLRARSGPLSRVFEIEFNIFSDYDTLSSSWRNNWKAVSSGAQSVENLSIAVPVELTEEDSALQSLSANEKWLDFLFYPGRFTLPTLETALHVYLKGINPKPRSRPNDSLKERITTAVKAKIKGSRSYDRQEIDIFEAWHVFYGLVQDLHKRRGGILSFAMDEEDRTPWIVSADFASPVRTCTDLEVAEFHYTADTLSELEGRLSGDNLSTRLEAIDLFEVAQKFRDIVTPQTVEEFRSVLFNLLLQNATTSVRDRIETLYETSGLGESISDPDWNMVRDKMDEISGGQNGYAVLKLSNFEALIDGLNQTQKGKRNSEGITQYGSRALIRTAQEHLQLATESLLNLLLLVVFVNVEGDETELKNDTKGKWRGHDAYVKLAQALRNEAILGFVMKNVRTEKQGKVQSATAERSSRSFGSSEDSPQLVIPSQQATYTSTLMESLFIGDWSDLVIPTEFEIPEQITYWARCWVSSLDLTNRYDNFAAHVFADLINHLAQHKDIDDESLVLLEAFVPYVPNNAWLTYLKGRYNLLRGDKTTAAIDFEKAAPLLSASEFNVADVDSADLIRPDQRSSFGSGLVMFYMHVMNLFISMKSPGHVVDFARLALEQHTKSWSEFTSSRKVSQAKNLTNLKASHDAVETEILSRMFTAALESEQLDVAYSALTRLDKTSSAIALRHSLLRAFVSHHLKSGQAEHLLSYPFSEDMKGEVDGVLDGMARGVIGLRQSKSPLDHSKVVTKEQKTIMRIPSFGSLVPNSSSLTSPAPKESLKASEKEAIQASRTLFALRTKQGDNRGAAQCLWEYLRYLQRSNSDPLSKSRSKLDDYDPTDPEIQRAFVVVLNALEMCPTSERYVLDENYAPSTSTKPLRTQKRRRIWPKKTESNLMAGSFVEEEEAMDVDSKPHTNGSASNDGISFGKFDSRISHSRPTKDEMKFAVQDRFLSTSRDLKSELAKQVVNSTESVEEHTKKVEDRKLDFAKAEIIQDAFQRKEKMNEAWSKGQDWADMDEDSEGKVFRRVVSIDEIRKMWINGVKMAEKLRRGDWEFGMDEAEEMDVD